MSCSESTTDSNEANVSNKCSHIDASNDACNNSTDIDDDTCDNSADVKHNINTNNKFDYDINTLQIYLLN